MASSWWQRVLDSLRTSSVAKSKRRRSLLGGVEPLEDRRLMATATWSGLSVVSNRWTTPANWSGNTAPVPGDDLVFPHQAFARDRARNDFPTDTVFNNISIEGDRWSLGGNRIKVTGNISNKSTETILVGSENVINLDIKFGAGLHVISNDHFDFSDQDFIIKGAISDDGTEGELQFTSPSDVSIVLSGLKANTYDNPITVAGSTLILDKPDNVPAISGPFSIVGAEGFVSPRARGVNDRLKVGQLAVGIDVFVSNSPINGLRVSRETIGSLDLFGGFVGVSPTEFRGDTPGTLTLTKTLTSFGQSEVSSGNLVIANSSGTRDFNVLNNVLTIGSQLSGGSLRKLGQGKLILNPLGGSNAHTRTQIQEGVLEVQASVAGRTVLPGDVSIGTAGGFGTATLRLSATNEVIANDADITVGFRGKLEMSGGATETIGDLEFNTPNNTSTLTNATLTLTRDLDVNANQPAFTSLALSSARLNVTDDAFIDNTTLALSSSSRIAFNDNLSLRGTTVDMSADSSAFLASNLNINGSDVSSVMNGNLRLKTGPHNFSVTDGLAANDFILNANLLNETFLQFSRASVTKLGAGTLVSTGINRHSGTSSVQQGLFRLKGTQLQSSIIASAGTILTGGGTAGNVSMNSGSTFDPGNGAGVFHATNFAFGFGSKYAPKLNSATAFDQLQTEKLFLDRIFVNGEPLFATLVVKPNFDVPLGTSFKIIDVTGTEPANLDTTFQNGAGVQLVDGATFNAAGQAFTIDYNGGDGNDVVITRNTAPAFQNRSITPEITEGGVATLSGHITEPNPHDAFFLDVDWGDGTVKTYRFAPGTPRDIEVRHRYLDDPAGPNDRYHVRLSCAISSVVRTVGNSPPSFAIPPR